MPSAMPLSRTASITSSVMSRTARPPAVRSSVSRWKTFTAPSTLLGRTCDDRPILRVPAAYVTSEPSIARAAAVVAGRGHPAIGGRGAAPGSSTDHDRPFHALLPVAVDGAIHLVGAAGGEGELDRLLGTWLDVAG